MNINTPEHWNAAWEKHHIVYAADNYRKGLAAQILSHIPVGSTVLDLGGGCGPFSMLAEGRDVTVLDFSAWSVEYLQSRGIKALVWDAREPEAFDVGQVDAIVCTEFLEHLDNPELVIEFTAKHTNLAFFSVPNNIMGPESCTEHVRVYNMDTFVTALREYWPIVTVFPGFSLLAITRKK
jgi:2-polyprenyl-3-methyl-5-hydroxy-6-metoxy-1,4-benzoquinol methylase